MRSLASSRRFPGAACLLALCALPGGCGGGDGIPVVAATEPPAGVLLLDLVERAASAAVRLAHAAHHFDDEGDGLRGAGWSAPRRVPGTDLSFAWATSRRATLRLPLRDPRSRWLHVRCQAAASDSSAPQTMTVTVDDVEVGAAELRAGVFDVHAFELPDGAAARDAIDVALGFARLAPDGRSPLAGDLPAVAAACDYVAVTGARQPPPTWQTPRLTHVHEARGDRLFQPAGLETAFTVTVPDDARLEFRVREAFGVGEAAGGGAAALRATLSIRRPERGETVVFDEPLQLDDARDLDGATRWQADLSSLAGEDVELIFRTIGQGRAPRGADWLAPRLYGAPGALDTTTNVVLIVADTLRADYLGSYGGSARTPNLDALAASGVRFENAYCHIPMTVPSHASMFTSLLPTEHAALNNGSVLSEQHLTLPELLRRTGYRHTAAFISLGVLTSEFGVAQGFTEYHQRFGADWWKTAAEVNAELLPWLERRPPQPFFLWAHYSDPHEPYAAPGREFPAVRIRPGDAAPVAAVPDGKRTRLWVEVPPDGLELAFSLPGETLPWPLRVLHFTSSDARVTADCGARCQDSPLGEDSRQYFLEPPGSLALRNAARTAVATELVMQVSDYPPPDEVRRRYREEVEYLDRQIGRLLAALRATSRPEDTLIVFTSDHGEELFEHGVAGHVMNLYDTVLRVPLLVHWPGRLAAGTVVRDVVSHIDLLPTVLDWLRVRDPEVRSGRSLLPLFARPPGAFSAEPVVVETFRPESPRDRQAFIAGRRKLILTPADERAQLFDLDADPGEHENLAAREPGATADLTARLQARLAEARDRALAVEQRALTEEEIQRLRSLGYLR